MNKVCKQCTRSLPDTEQYFKSYVPRGRGLRKSSVGRHTICRDCEHINETATRIWKRGPQNPKETELLEKFKTYYNKLVDKGGHPVGAYANHLLEQSRVAQGRSKVSFIDEMLNRLDGLIDEPMPVTVSMVTTGTGDPLLAEYDKLLAIEMTDEPDVYQAMLDELRERTVGPDGRVKAEYKQKFEAVATRFDDYEDGYEWDR